MEQSAPVYIPVWRATGEGSLALSDSSQVHDLYICLLVGSTHGVLCQSVQDPAAKEQSRRQVLKLFERGPNSRKAACDAAQETTGRLGCVRSQADLQVKCGVDFTKQTLSERAKCGCVRDNHIDFASGEQLHADPQPK